MSRLYTRTGDAGTTGLGNGQRVYKNDIRLEICGTLDELNSIIGLLLTYSLPIDIAEHLLTIQRELFILGGELSLSGHQTVTADQVTRLETLIDQYSEHLPPLKEFILPGGTQTAAVSHLARTVCRRAERLIVTLMENDTINSYCLIYLNRLSDLLFVFARQLVRQDGGEEIRWNEAINYDD